MENSNVSNQPLKSSSSGVSEKPILDNSVSLDNDVFVKDRDSRDEEGARKRIVTVGLLLVSLAVFIALLIGVGAGYALCSVTHDHNQESSNSTVSELTTDIPQPSTTKADVDLTDVALLPGTNCTSTTVFSHLYTCDRAIDKRNGTRWTTSTKYNTGQYIEVNFPQAYTINRVGFRPHCYRAYQCDVIQVDFSNGEPFMINRTCTGKEECPLLPLQIYPVPRDNNTKTRSLRLTCLHQCSTEHHWTLYDIAAWSNLQE